MLLHEKICMSAPLFFNILQVLILIVFKFIPVETLDLLPSNENVNWSIFLHFILYIR